MGMVMTRCPATGRELATGLTADRVAYGATPVFFARVYCDYCNATHEWFARDGWVCEIVSRTAPASRLADHRAG